MSGVSRYTQIAKSVVTNSAIVLWCFALNSATGLQDLEKYVQEYMAIPRAQFQMLVGCQCDAQRAISHDQVVQFMNKFPKQCMMYWETSSAKNENIAELKQMLEYHILRQIALLGGPQKIDKPIKKQPVVHKETCGIS